MSIITGLIIVSSVLIFLSYIIKIYYKYRAIDKTIELNYNKYYKQKWVLHKK
jgi:hypothetical protein